MGNIFVVGACTAGKGRQGVASFVGKIFVVRPPTAKTTNMLPMKIIRYIYTVSIYGGPINVELFHCCVC